MKRYVAGIDADLTASGVAIWDRKLKEWASVTCIPPEDCVASFSQMDREDVIIYVEAGWMNKQANFRRGQKFSVSESMAMRVGMNHAVSILTARALKKAGFEVVEIKPLGKGSGLLKNSKGWTKYGTEWIEQQSGLKKLNGEKKDAVMIAMHYR